MITLEIGKSNKVGLKVSAPESLSVFYASLSACGTIKTAVTNDKGEAYFVFSDGDVARVAKDMQGEYGTLTITDSEGTVRIKALPCFRACDEDPSSTDKDRTIFVSVPKKVNMGSGGGSTIDLSAYATKEDLSEANTENKQYTDEKISDIVTPISSQLHTPKAGVKSLQAWAIKLSNILRGVSEENADE